MKVTNPIFIRFFTCYLIVLFTRIWSNNAHSQEFVHPVFFGSIKNNRTDGKPDTLSIGYLKPFTPTGVVTTKVIAVADKNGNFKFKLPYFAHPIKMIVHVRHNNRSERLNDGYLVNGDDNVQMDIIRDGVQLRSKFSGRGSAKYNVANTLDSLIQACAKEREIAILKNQDLDDNLGFVNELVDRYEAQKQLILNKSNLEDHDKALVRYAYANLFDFWNRVHSTYMQLEIYKGKKNQDKIKENFNANKGKYRYPVDTAMIHAGNFINLLGVQEAKEIFMSNTPLVEMTERFYVNIKTKYSGMIRERLLSNFFIGNKGMIPIFEHSVFRLDSLMKDGQKYITVPMAKKLYLDKLRLKKGEKIFDGTYTGTDGQIMKISHLKGKVVLLDIWANGCSWCAIFHNRFHKEVWPEFKNNKNFVYLSINNGDGLKSWKANVVKGIYTARDYTNVTTGPNSERHSFNKYYSIESLPFMLLIDKKGEIFASKFGDMTLLKEDIRKLLVQ